MRIAWLVPFLFSMPAAADVCRIVDVDFLPQDKLQIVAWVEDTGGHYIDTIFITQSIGTYGMGNRPGRFDFNSGPTMFPSWPYGRRITTFPVWAHRHGMIFPEVEFQNLREDDLSHPAAISSPEVHYCKPLKDDEPGWDTGTCATMVFTDKGMLSKTGKTSLYPPRQDIVRDTVHDYIDVDMYGALNPFDAVSQATPAGGVPAQMSWVIPPAVPAGNYVMFVEVSREFDMNATYNPTSYPAPMGISFEAWGEPYRGQPSVVYSVPFVVSPSGATTAAGTDYLGYGDPDGLDGNVRPPDATITTAASRFQLVSDGGVYRVRITAHTEGDSIPPGAPIGPAVVALAGASATVAFTAPGDDGTVGKVSGYEIRYRTGSDMTEDNFLGAGSNPVAAVAPGPPGSVQSFALDKLLPETEYSVGIRAFDKCHNLGPLGVVTFRTADRAAGEVDACFVATAAYGSKLAADVGSLRHFRDTVLRRSVLGELAIETYYTFGPALAGAIGESDLLRATAREVLAPIVTWVRTLAF